MVGGDYGGIGYNNLITCFGGGGYGGVGFAELIMGFGGGGYGGGDVGVGYAELRTGFSWQRLWRHWLQQFDNRFW